MIGLPDLSMPLQYKCQQSQEHNNNMQSNLIQMQYDLPPYHCDTVSQASTEGDEHDISFTDPQKQCMPKPRLNSKIKTSLCKKFSENCYCPYGDKCQFAHGIKELRCKNDDNKYKTRPCNAFFKKNYCSYGPRCNFSHKQSIEQGNESQTSIGFRQVLYLRQTERSRLFAFRD